MVATGRGVAENKAIAGSEDDRVFKPEAHDAGGAGLGCFVAIEGNGGHALGGEGVEVKAGSMFQGRRVGEQANLGVECGNGGEGVGRNQRLAAAHVGKLDAGKIDGDARAGLGCVLGLAMGLQSAHAYGAGAGLEQKGLAFAKGS